jgi:hypothetical protein
MRWRSVLASKKLRPHPEFVEGWKWTPRMSMSMDKPDRKTRVLAQQAWSNTPTMAGHDPAIGQPRKRLKALDGIGS